MQNINQLLNFDPENPEPYQPELERVSEADVLFAKNVTYREEVRAKARTIMELMQHGMQVDDTPNGDMIAAEIMMDREPYENHSDKPDIILHLAAMMTEFDHEVVRDAVQMRRVVTNKLLLEASTAEKASERIKALELLGKISDVGLFAERSIVTIEHKTTAELQKEFEETIQLLLNPKTNTYEEPKTIKTPDVSIKDIKIGV
jgi:hypothetical protein